MELTQPQSSRFQRIDSLDGFRAIAITAVLGFHAPVMWPEIPWTIDPMRKGGFIGVDMFFVLSGFLITSLLIKEHSETGTVNFKKFFLRRSARLIPPLLLCIVVSLGLTIHFEEDLRIFLSTATLSIFYVFNWGVVFGLKRSLQIGHLWSLSLEEQFYSAIAIVVFLYRRLTKIFSLQKFVVITSLLIISWSIIAKIYILRTGDLSANWVSLYFRTDLRADTFFIGSLAAVYRQNHSSKPAKLVGATFLPSVFVLVTYMISANTDDSFNYRGGLTIVAIASAFVILAASYPGTIAERFLSLRPLKSIGLLSYSIYLIHMPVFDALSPNNASMKFVLRLPIALIAILFYSVLSYFLLERPLTKLRRRSLS